MELANEPYMHAKAQGINYCWVVLMQAHKYLLSFFSYSYYFVFFQEFIQQIGRVKMNGLQR